MSNDPILQFHFNGPTCRRLTEYTELQRAVMPVVGITPEAITPLATCFGISTSIPLVVTAWHVIREFIDDHERGLSDGSCQLAAIWETNERIPGTDMDLGGPHPVYEVMYQDRSDLALMLLFEVTSGDRVLVPGAVAPLQIGVSPAADYCYGFGYPHLKGGPIRLEGGRAIVEMERTMHVCAGRVIESFPTGQVGHAMVAGPSLHCDAPLPHGMSGGPVLTDRVGICGAWSSALDPYEESDPWTSYVTLLHPMLDFEVRHCGVTVRELVADGRITIDGSAPPAPSDRPVTNTMRFPPPRRPHVG